MFIVYSNSMHIDDGRRAIPQLYVFMMICIYIYEDKQHRRVKYPLFAAETAFTKSQQPKREWMPRVRKGEQNTTLFWPVNILKFISQLYCWSIWLLYWNLDLKLPEAFLLLTKHPTNRDLWQYAMWRGGRSVSYLTVFIISYHLTRFLRIQRATLN